MIANQWLLPDLSLECFLKGQSSPRKGPTPFATILKAGKIVMIASQQPPRTTGTSSIIVGRVNTVSMYCVLLYLDFRFFSVC